MNLKRICRDIVARVMPVWVESYKKLVVAAAAVVFVCCYVAHVLTSSRKGFVSLKLRRGASESAVHYERYMKLQGGVGGGGELPPPVWCSMLLLPCPPWLRRVGDGEEEGGDGELDDILEPGEGVSIPRPPPIN
ncbi:hypothetical protein TKK_0012762 [Trichogramma kaykai]